MKLRKHVGKPELIKKVAEDVHELRKKTQPGPCDNLGSLYHGSKGYSVIGYMLKTVSKTYGLFLFIFGYSVDKIRKKEINLIFSLLGEKKLIPYAFGFQRYMWKDERAHDFFWDYHRVHQIVFKESNFEIEIKGIE